MKIIGLLGGKGVGKNTAAAYLARAYGAKLYALADELKELLRDVFKLSQEQLHGSQVVKETIDERWGLSPRQLMERQGDALRRVYGDMFQTDRLLVQIAADAPRLAVVCDVRYPHEALRIRSQGALWRLHYAPGLQQWPSSHSSEAYWLTQEVDVELTPFGKGVEHLHASLDEACNAYNLEKGHYESARA